MADPPDHRAALHLHRLYSSAMPDCDGIHELRRLGVDIDHMLNVVGPVVRILATFPGDGSFEPDSMGEVAFLVPAMGEDAETHVDLVAWAARDPGTFGTLFGTAGVLGADAIVNPASFRLGPCPIWAMPLRWLQADCGGAVVLDPEIARATFKKAPAGSFLAEDEDLADDLVAYGLVSPERLVVATRKAVAA